MHRRDAAARDNPSIMENLLFVGLASLFAGFIDAIVGGGGLILVPALFAGFPGSPPATLLGTNKVAGVWGTAFATWRYARQVRIDWPVIGRAALAALVGSFVGAWTVTQVDPGFLRKLLPFVLLAMLIYTLARKDMGRAGVDIGAPDRLVRRASVLGAAAGFYDGFFGPGTGSLLVFGLVKLLGYDFLQASAGAKVLNTATNLAALVLFAATGHVWWHFAVVMAVANVAGSLLGTTLALRRGVGFVRGVFILVVAALILRTGYDAFLK